MAEGISAFMPIAMRMVGDAIRLDSLDSQNCKKEAYCQYLSCCVYISQILKDDVWNKDLKLVYNKDTAKLFQLIQRCQERAVTIISEGINPTESPSGSPVLPPSQLSHTLPPPQDKIRQLSDSSLPTRDMGKPAQGIVRTSSGSLLNFPSPPSSSSLGHLNSTSMRSPSRCNYHQADRRPVSHHLRVAKFNTNNTDKTLMSIRRMSENLVMAKKREEAIRKKVWERQQRLQEEANRRFASSVAVSQEEQEQRALYTKILEYEQDMVWPRQLREKLKQTPEDTALINDIINKIFSSKDHPLRQFLLQYQYHVYKKLLPLLKDVNFPDAKHLHKASNNSAPHDDKDSTNACPISKDTSSKLNEIEEQTSELGCRCTGLEEDDSSKNVEETSKAVNEENPDDNLEEPDKSNYITEVLKNEDNITKDDDTDQIEDDIFRINEEPDNEDYNTDVLKNEDNITKDDDTNQNEDDIFSINDTNDTDNEDYTTEVLKNEDNITTDDDTNQIEDDIFRINEKTSSGKSENEIFNNTNSESKNEKNMCEDDISSIVSSIIEDILDEVEKAGPESITMANDKKKSCINTKERKEDNVSQEQKIIDNNEEEAICSNDTEITSSESDRNPNSCKENVSDQERNELADSSSFDSIKGKNKSIFRLKYFDVESEFESLEDDMFDSESSEDEGETDENSVPAISAAINEPNTEIAKTADTHNKFDNNPSLQPHNEESSSAESTKDGSTNVVEQNADTNQAQAELTISHEEDLELTRKQLNEIFVDMRFFLEKLKGFIILAYEELATPVGHDQCYAAVEFPFFQPLWPLLFGVLRRLNFDKELSLGCMMTKRIRDPPAEMGVVERLCLLDQDSLPGNQYAYQPAVEQLHKVSTSYCPLIKLDYLVRVLRSICQCVEDYWESKGKPRHCHETSIGCDDLLPVLCYVIVRSGMAQLVSECSAMEEFIPEGYLMGEEGYCLTTLQTALAYLVTQE